MKKPPFSILLSGLIMGFLTVPDLGTNSINTVPCSYAQSRPSITSVSPLDGTTGQELAIELHGNSFSETTRIAIVPQPSSGYNALDLNGFEAPCTWIDCGAIGPIHLHDDMMIILRPVSQLIFADISNPGKPSEIGEFTYTYGGYHIAIENDVAYLMGRYYGGLGSEIYYLMVIDLNDVSNPVLLGETYIGETGGWDSSSLRDYPVDMDVRNRMVYITCARSGMVVIDASVPSIPHIISHFNENDLENNGISRFERIDVLGPYAYVAAGVDGMAVMDISDPAAPALVTLLDTPGNCQDIAVSGQTAFVADMGNAMVSIDISDPTHPHIAGSLPLYGNVNTIHVRGDRAWVLAPNVAQYHLVDVENASSPVLVASASFPETATELPENLVSFVALSDKMLYMRDNNCMVVAPVPEEISDAILRNDKTLTFTVPPPPTDIDYRIRVFDGGQSAISTQTISFASSDPVQVTVDYPDEAIKAIPVGELPTALAFTPDEAYIWVPNKLDNSISIIGTSDHSVMQTIPTDNAPDQIVFSPSGETAYLICQGDNIVSDNSLSVIRTSDFSVQKTIPLGFYAGAMKMSPDGNTLYIGNRSENSLTLLRTVDTAITGDIPVGGRISGITPSPDGTFLYILNGAGDIYVIRISDNRIEKILSFEELPGFEISPDGSYLYVSLRGMPLQVIETAGYTVVKTFPEITGRSALTVSPDGDYVYASAWREKLHVIRTSDMTVVKTVDPFCTPSVWSITPEGKYLYSATEDGTYVSILRTSDGKIVKTVPAGMTPSVIRATSDGSQVYVLNVWAGNISVLANTHDMDDDADGVTENQGDCDDTDPSVYPGAEEICGDGIDQDCNGEDLVCCAVSITSPLEGETWNAGTTHSISWDETGPECASDVKMSYSTDYGASWNEIASGIPDSGVYQWAVPASLETDQARVKVEGVSGGGYSGATAYAFSIAVGNDGDGNDGNDGDGNDGDGAATDSGGSGGCFISLFH